MASSINSIQVAQVVGVVSSIWVSGEIFTYGYAAAPLVQQAIQTSPKLAGQLWNRMFFLGARIGAPMAVIASSSFIYLRTQTGDGTYTLAAAFPVSIIAFTFLPMAKTIRTIFEIVDTEGRVEKHSGALDGWLENWARLNYIRAALPLIGALFALKAIVA